MTMCKQEHFYETAKFEKRHNLNEHLSLIVVSRVNNSIHVNGIE